MDFTYNCTLAFLRLAIEQIRLIDNTTADLLREHHLSKLSKVFQLAVEQRQLLGLDHSQREAEGRIANKAINLLDALRQLLPSGSQGSGSPIDITYEMNNGNAGRYFNRHRELSDSQPDTASPSPKSGTAMPGHAVNGQVKRVIEGPQRRIPQYGIIGEQRETGDSSLSPPQLARKALFENSEPELEPTSRVSSGTVGSWPSAGRNLTGDSVCEFSIASSNTSNDSTDSTGVYLDRARLDTIGNRINAERPNTGANANTWAKIATIAKPHGTVATVIPKAGHFDGRWTDKLSQAQVALNPASRLEQAIRDETTADKLRVVWITNLPSHYNLYRLGVHINRGPIMSVLMGRGLDPALPGHSVCIIFRYASEAREFCMDNHLVNNAVLKDADKTTYNPAGDICPASLLADAHGALLLPLATYGLDADLLAMDAPGFARRRIKWSRARLFHDVNMVTFKRDVFSICGRNNVELFHFYNPGEATAVFSSVKVAAVVKAWFDARSKRLGPGSHGVEANKTWDARYEGVDVSFCKGFEESRPDKLISSYARNGAVRRVTEEKGLEGLYMGPPVLGLVTRAK